MQVTDRTGDASRGTLTFYLLMAGHKGFSSGPFKRHERVVCPEQVRPNDRAERVERALESISDAQKGRLRMRQAFLFARGRPQFERRRSRASVELSEQSTKCTCAAPRGTRRIFIDGPTDATCYESSRSVELSRLP